MSHCPAHDRVRDTLRLSLRDASAALLSVVGLGIALLLASVAVAEPASTPAHEPGPWQTGSAPPAAPAPGTRTLEELTLLPIEMFYVMPHARTPDEAIAAAVATGSDPDLEPRHPFRKHSVDLFRTERQIEIADQEMLLRLRVRARMRETMSVELHF